MFGWFGLRAKVKKSGRVIFRRRRHRFRPMEVMV
jgi:hypothetical protein